MLVERPAYVYRLLLLLPQYVQDSMYIEIQYYSMHIYRNTVLVLYSMCIEIQYYSMCLEIQLLQLLYIQYIVNTIIVPKHSKWCFRFLFHLFNI